MTKLLSNFIMMASPHSFVKVYVFFLFPEKKEGPNGWLPRQRRGWLLSAWFWSFSCKWCVLCQTRFTPQRGAIVCSCRETSCLVSLTMFAPMLLNTGANFSLGYLERPESIVIFLYLFIYFGAFGTFADILTYSSSLPRYIWFDGISILSFKKYKFSPEV